MQDAHLLETEQSLKPIRPQHQQRQRQNQQFEGGENFDYYVDRKIGWRYCREPRGNPPAASSSSWWKSSGETRRIKKKKIQKIPTILRLRSGTIKRNPLPKTVKLGSNPLHKEPVLQLTRKVKRIQSDMRPLLPNVAEHIPLYGSRLLHGQENLWKTTWRSYESFECEFGYLMNVHEYHSPSSSSSRKRLWHEFEICKELSLGNNRRAFQGNGKADQWSDKLLA